MWGSKLQVLAFSLVFLMLFSVSAQAGPPQKYMPSFPFGADDYIMYSRTFLPSITLPSLIVGDLYVPGRLYANETHITNTTIEDVNVTRNLTVEHTGIFPGNVSIGTTAPFRSLTVGDGSGDDHIAIYSVTDGIGQLAFADAATGAGRYAGAVKYDHDANLMSLLTSSITQVVIDSSGNVGIKNTTPLYTLSVGSADGSDQLGIYHDNSNAYITWTDGELNLITDEGTNSVTSVNIKGKGTGLGIFRIYDETNAHRLEQTMFGGQAFISIRGDSPTHLNLQHYADVTITMFLQATAGETPELLIYGYRNFSGSADALRKLEIGVGVDANDTASFDGVSNYYFDGNVGIGTTAPTAKLTVSELVQIQGDTNPQFPTTGAGIEIGYDSDDAGGETTGRGVLQAFDRDGSVYKSLRINALDIEFQIGGNEKVKIDNSGNVGIGTAAPNSTVKLHVVGGDVKIEGGDFNVTDGNIVQTSPGNSTINLIRSEMHFHNDTDGNVTALDEDVWNNVTAFDQEYNGQTLNGFSYLKSTLTAGVAGEYLAGYGVTFTGTANNKYHATIAVNEALQFQMEGHDRISTGSDVMSISNSEFISVNAGDKITLMIMNEDSGGDATILSAQTWLVRIGD